ncbi:hypothetical protein [Paraburkholderia sp. BL6669N2]|uniref:hypothetical protein n=1 Tax=Paraburkholderia sp. BL6669N2 TaxID=1938807 RepID=UPI0011C0334C|nr:hypothetical protein [Paraburkholderia sp. BL6669N2]
MANDDVRRTLWVSNFVEKIKSKPEKLLFLSEAERDYRVATRNRAFDEYLINLPQRLAEDVFPGKKVPLGFDYLRDSIPGRPQTINKLREYYNEDPSAFYHLGEKTFDILGKRKDELTDRELGYRNVLEKEIKSGTIPAPNADIKTLLNGAPGTAMNAIAERLIMKSDSDKRAILSSNESLKSFIQQEFGSSDAAFHAVSEKIDNGYKRIDTLNEQVDRLTNEADIKRAKERRDADIAEGRAGIYIASKLIGISDPEGARIVDVGGNASIDIAVAVATITDKGLSLAATGNIVQAAFAVAGLFDKSPDVSAVHHKQIISFLSQISDQLTVINNKLDVANDNIILVISGIQELKQGQSESTAAVVNRIDALDRQIGDEFRNMRNDHIALLAQPFKAAQVACQNAPSGREFVDKQDSNMGVQASNCLSQSQIYALETSKDKAFNYADFNFDSGTLSTLKGLPDVYDFLGVTPQIFSRVGIFSNLSNFKVKDLQASDFANLPHPDALADGVSAFIELRDRIPEMPYDNEKSILRSFLDEAERLKRVFDVAYEADSDTSGKYTTQPYLKSLDDLEAALREVEPSYFAYAEANSQALKGLGLPIWCFNGTGSADNNLCNSKISLFTEIGSQTPRHPDLEHILGYFAGADLGVTGLTPHRTDTNTETTTSGPNGVVSTVTACGRYQPTIDIVRDLSGQGLAKNFYTFTKNERCQNFVSKASATTTDASADLAHQFQVFIDSLRQERSQFAPPPGQAWDDPTQALAISQRILAVRRNDFGNWTFREFTNNHLPKLSSAVESVDRSAFAWEFLERIGRGGCFAAIPSKVELFDSSKPNGLLKSTEIKSLLAAGDLMGIVNRIKDVKTRKVKVKAKGQEVEVVAIAAGNVEDYDLKSCSRLPASLARTLRDLDVRRALLDVRLRSKR